MYSSAGVDSDSEAILLRDAEWHLNNAYAEMEMAYCQEENGPDDDLGTRARIREHVDKALEMSPGDPYARTLNDALENWKPDELPAIIHSDRIAWLTALQDIGIVETEFSEAKKHKSDFTHALFMLASAYRTLGEESKFEKLCTRIVQRDPNHARAIFDLATLACRRGDEEAEMAGYKRAVAADPTYAEPWYNMAITYADQGENDAAERCYLKALECDSGHGNAVENYALLLFREGDPARAIEMMRGLATSQPLRERTYANWVGMGAMLRSDEVVSEALAYWQRALPRSQERESTLEQLGIA